MYRCEYRLRSVDRNCLRRAKADGRCTQHHGKPTWWLEEVKKPETVAKLEECAICFESKILVVLKDCKHSMCQNCINHLERRLCPFCRVPLTDYNKQKDDEIRTTLNMAGSSARNRTVEELERQSQRLIILIQRYEADREASRAARRAARRRREQLH